MTQVHNVPRMIEDVGPLSVGGADGTTDVDTAGHQTMSGDARPWKDAIGDALSLKVQGTGAAANAADSTIEFSTAARMADYLYTNVQLNHDRDETSAIYPHVHWLQASGENPNFLVQYRWQTNGGAKATAWTSLKANVPVFNYLSGTIHQICRTAAITAPAASTLSDIVQFRLIRDTANSSTTFTGSDPYTATVGVMSFDVHYQINSLGSDTEYEK